MSVKQGYGMAIQCTDRTSGKRGDFICDRSQSQKDETTGLYTQVAVSPVFDDILPLYAWMKENGWRSEQSEGNPWGVVKD